MSKVQRVQFIIDVERRFGVSVRGFSTGELFVGFSLCVGSPILCGFLVAGCAHAFSSLVGLDASEIATRGQRRFFFLFGGHGDVRSIGPPLNFVCRLAGGLLPFWVARRLTCQGCW